MNACQSPQVTPESITTASGRGVPSQGGGNGGDGLGPRPCRRPSRAAAAAAAGSRGPHGGDDARARPPVRTPRIAVPLPPSSSTQSLPEGCIQMRVCAFVLLFVGAKYQSKFQSYWECSLFAFFVVVVCCSIFFCFCCGAALQRSSSSR